MKKVLLALGLATSSLFAQESVNLADGKTNQSYYSFANGEVANISNLDWDIAFYTGEQRATPIRINSQKIIKLYETGVTAEDWDDLVDDSNKDNWTALINSSTDLLNGAFNNATKDPNDRFDMAWGSYNFISHGVYGSKTFVIEVPGQDLKKIRIDAMTASAEYEKTFTPDAFTFTLANLDGTNEEEVIMPLADYSGKEFGYYSVETNSVLDREPLSSSWDVVFTKYWENVGSEERPWYMAVTGVLSSPSVQVSEIHKKDASLDDISLEDLKDFPYASESNVIGYDWKTRGGDGYTVSDTTFFIVKTASNDAYKFSIADFITDNGQFTLKKELLEVTASFEEVTNEFVAYPMPASTTLNVDLASSSQANLTIYNALGNVVYVGTAQNKAVINTSNLASGVYILAVNQEGKTVTKQFVIK